MKFFIFKNDHFKITLTVTDNDGATSSTSTTIKVEPFSFAIITDLHIGRGYDDYDSSGFDDSGDGEDYYLTKRLKKVVDWIIQNKDKVDCEGTKCKIKFLAVLGDISDSGELSEFCKAKEILDKLNEYDILYVPLFGNHDVYSYTKENPGELKGPDFFEKVFWTENPICKNATSSKNFKKLKEELNFKRDEINKSYKNFLITYGGINFIGLDFNSREKEEKWYLGPTGVKGEAVNHPETINWLKEKLNELEGKEPVVIFSHEPFAKTKSRIYPIVSKKGVYFPRPEGNFSELELQEIKDILDDYENKFEGHQILANFGGHIHGFEKWGKELRFFGQFSPIDLFFNANWQYPSLSTIPVITTEALMVGGNEKDLSNKGLIRIVKVIDKENIDFSEIKFKEPALNPYFAYDFKVLPDQIYPCVHFAPDFYTKREFSYKIEYGDGKADEIGSGVISTDHCYSPLFTPAVYTVRLVAKDKETGKEEWITREVEIKKGIIPKMIKVAQEIKEKFEFKLSELKENALEFGRTMRDKVLILTKPKSPQIPIGIIDVHYEKATEDIDLTQMKVNTDIQRKKSLLYMPQWPDVIGKEKILFIPK
mgnify:CR=1 FL=1